MHIRKSDVPVQLDASGAVARLQPGSGSAAAYGSLSAEDFWLTAGTDISPLLEGLPYDVCQAPHWGGVAKGRLTVRDGSSETLTAGELFYWPPGHTAAVHEKSELLMFSPEKEHLQVLTHMRGKMG